MLYVGSNKYKVILGNNRYKAIYEKPYDYEVEYLESDGTNIFRVDTGFIPTADCTIHIECMQTNNQSLGFWPIANSKWYNQLGAFEFVVNQETHCRFNYENANRSHVFNGNKVLGDYIKINITTTSSSVTFNYIVESRGYNQNYTFNYSPSLIAQEQVCIWNRNHSSADATCGRIYKWQAFVNNVAVRDFIPVVKDNVGYFYDKVTKQLYSDANGNSFVVGPRITN